MRSVCRWGPLVSLASFLWLIFAAVIFTLPTKFAITGGNFNYAPVAVGGVCLIATLAWVLSASNWFNGPRIDVDNSDAVRTKYWITDPPRKGLAAGTVRLSRQWKATLPADTWCKLLCIADTTALGMTVLIVCIQKASFGTNTAGAWRNMNKAQRMVLKSGTNKCIFNLDFVVALWFLVPVCSEGWHLSD